MFHHLVYAKRFLLPIRTANGLQSQNMAFAFAQNGVQTTLYPGAFDSGQNPLTSLERDFCLTRPDTLRITLLSAKHKGVYGLKFRAHMLKDWLTGKQTIFYTRDIKEGLFLARLKKRLGIRRPLFFEMHEVLSNQHQRMDTGKAQQYHSQEATLLSQVNGVIAISPLLIQEIKDTYPGDYPVYTAPMGFNPSLYTPVPPVNFDNDVSLIYVGSLYPGKGVRNLVRAMKLLPSRFRLTIVGGTPEQELQTVKKHAFPLGDRITFTGRLSPKEVAGHMRKSHIFMVPQWTETEYFSPLKLYEAMGMALPIITTPVPTITSAVTHGKEVYISRDTSPQGLADAVLSLSRDQELAHRMQRHVMSIASRFTWQERARNCLEFMHSATNGEGT